MSFGLFVRSFRQGQSWSYPSEIAESIFDRGALRPSKLHDVAYQDGGGEIYCKQNYGECEGFTLSRFGGRTICERALEIAAVTQSLIFWPSPNIIFGVTDLAFVAHLPPELKEEYVALVRNVDELWAAISA